MMGHPSNLIVEIWPGWVYLDVEGIQGLPKAYGDNLLDLILEDLPRGSKVYYRGGAVPKKPTHRKPTRKELRK